MHKGDNHKTESTLDNYMNRQNKWCTDLRQLGENNIYHYNKLSKLSEKTTNYFHFNLTYNNTYFFTRLNPTLVNAITDSSATSTYFRTIDVKQLVINTPVIVTQANGDHLTSTHTTIMNIPQLSPARKQGYVYIHLHPHQFYPSTNCVMMTVLYNSLNISYT